MTKLRYRFFFLFYNSEYLCFIDIPCQNSAKISSGFEEEDDFVVFAFLVTAVILDIRPDPILQF